MKSLEQRFPVYSKLIRLYPHDYQKQYGTSMLQTTADMLDGAASPWARLLIWSRITTDVAITIGKQRLHKESGGKRMRHNTLQRSLLAAALTLVVFFIGSFAIFANLFSADTMLRAMVVTLPAHTGSVFNDYALTVFQGVVLAGGMLAVSWQLRKQPRQQ